MSLHSWVGFSYKELRGIAVWLVLLLGGWFLPEWYGWIYADRDPKPLTMEQQQELDAFLAQVTNHARETMGHDALSVRYQAFDPNQLDTKVGRQLGLADRQIQMIQRYVAKGGRFEKKEDFRKIYAISEDDYHRLSPYIQIKKPMRRPSDTRRAGTPLPEPIKNKERKVLSINLNETDSTELLALPGIGPVFASRIVRYRDRLGGFAHVEQLLEVYGMDEERLQGLETMVFAQPHAVKMIPINRADYRQLRNHPYVNSNQANAIVRYREQHGAFATMHDLEKIVLLDADFLRKIAAYISFE